MKTKLFFLFFLVLFATSYGHAAEKGLPCDNGDGANGSEVPEQQNLTIEAQNLDCKNNEHEFTNVRRIELTEGGLVGLFNRANGDNSTLTGVFRFGLHRQSMAHGGVRTIMQIKTRNPQNNSVGDAFIYLQEFRQTDNWRDLRIWLRLVNQNSVIQDLPLGAISFVENEMNSNLDYRFKIRVAQNAAGFSVFSLECMRLGSSCQYYNVGSNGPVTTDVMTQRQAYFRFDPNQFGPSMLDETPRLIVKLVW